jgi:hypothetical protein
MRSQWFNIVLLAGWVTPAFALVVSPSRTELHLAPGAGTPMQLSVTNDEHVPLEIGVSKKDWFLPEANKAWTVDRWMTIEGPEHFSLKPGESRRVNLEITCPKELKGEVVAMASFVYRTENPSMVTPMISVSVYLMAAGTESRMGEVEDVMVRRNKDQLSLSAKVKSTGSVHLRPSGRIVVTDAKGIEIAQLAVAEGQPTYPGTDALYAGSVPFGPQLVPGTYQAKAELVYQEVKLEKSKEFTVLPDGQVQMSPIK